MFWSTRRICTVSRRYADSRAHSNYAIDWIPVRNTCTQTLCFSGADVCANWDCWPTKRFDRIRCTRPVPHAPAHAGFSCGSSLWRTIVVSFGKCHRSLRRSADDRWKQLRDRWLRCVVGVWRLSGWPSFAVVEHWWLRRDARFVALSWASSWASSWSVD